MPDHDDSSNPHVRGLGPSATLAVNERSEALQRDTPTIFELGPGQLPFPVPEPVAEELRRTAQQRDYLPVQGLAERREAAAEYHWQKDRVEARADGVLVGPGSKEHPPEGAFYLFLDFSSLEGLRERGIDTGARLCDRLLEETGVALLPGAPFGRPPKELTARLSFVDWVER